MNHDSPDMVCSCHPKETADQARKATRRAMALWGLLASAFSFMAGYALGAR